MKHQGLAVFALFFLLSLLDAVKGGRWIAAALWLLAGLCFLAMDKTRKRHPPSGMRGSPR